MKKAAPVKKAAPLKVALTASKKQESSAKAKEPDTTVTRRTKIRNFKKFNELPIEIRYRIYKYASFPGRLIRAKWYSQSTENRYHVSYMLEAGPVPTVLHLDKEARKEGLKYFKQVPNSLTFVEKDPEWPRKIYVNEADTFCIVNFPATQDHLIAVKKIAKIIPFTRLLFKEELVTKLINKTTNDVQSTGLPSQFLSDLAMQNPGLREIDFAVDKTHFSFIVHRPWNYTTFDFPLCSSILMIFGSRILPWYWDYLSDVWEKKSNWDSSKPITIEQKKWNKFVEKNPDWVPPKLSIIGIKRR